jgi:anti-sigma regulatory factor (Ser/Thr protein kinase)
MPLGLMPGMVYEEREAFIGPGDNVLLYSDGLVEAHDPSGAMYGFPRLRADLQSDLAGSELIDELLDRLHEFTGQGWEQEDDITLVALRRSAGAGTTTTEPKGAELAAGQPDHETTLLSLELPGAPGNERVAMDRVAEAVGPLGLDPARLERLKTAVSEATMNAIEYGSGGSPDIPVDIVVTSGGGEIRVRITDRALGGPIPGDDAEEPDLEAKLAGLQKARGWGLFLIRNMVDRVDVIPGDGRQTVTLAMALTGGKDATESA